MLVWAVLLAPQISLVHTLSHLSPHQPSSRSGDERQKATDKVCDSCLALAQIGAALPSQHEWRLHADEFAEPPALAPQTVWLPSAAPFLARAPPLALI